MSFLLNGMQFIAIFFKWFVFSSCSLVLSIVSFKLSFLAWMIVVGQISCVLPKVKMLTPVIKNLLGIS